MLSILFLTSPLAAATYTVDDDGPADFAYIQKAINFATSGDTILVKAGSYKEDLTLKTGVEVLGEGHDVTTLKGTGTGNVVLASGIEDAQLDGFTVYGSSGDHSYAGITINGGEVVISNNRIIKNINGIRIQNYAKGVIRNNIIEGNGSTGNSVNDYGILCLRSKPLITNNVVINNAETAIYIGWEESDGAQVINNTISDNGYDGVWCYRSAPRIKNNIIVNNNVGINAIYGAIPEISFNDVWNNTWQDYKSETGGIAAPGPGDISTNPLFDTDFPGQYYLGEDSLCIDAGDPNPIYNDIDGSRNDMGAYGGSDALLQPGFSPVTSGFLFTSLGKIPVSEITQSGVSIGLANVSNEVAQDLGIYKYTDAPFGGRLWISGLFGPDDTSVRYYQILAAKWEGDTPPDIDDFEPLLDPLTKIQYIINPDGTVTAKRVTLGPFSSGALEGLYQRTDSGYWAHRDLKMIWNSGWRENGKYDLTYRAFDWSLTEVILPDNTQERITVVVDNSSVTAQIHAVKYDTGDVIPECGIIGLGSPTENLKFVITAWHPNGFLRNYRLQALYGKNRDGGDVVKDQYVGFNDGSPPDWDGIQNVEINSADAPAGQLEPWEVCAYQFSLRVWARTTDGYHHIRYGEFNDHYYLTIGPQTTCKGDFDADGDVDGSDLSVFASEFGRTDCKP
jgi:parallel beta-helix repeat protein